MVMTFVCSLQATDTCPNNQMHENGRQLEGTTTQAVLTLTSVALMKNYQSSVSNDQFAKALHNKRKVEIFRDYCPAQAQYNVSYALIATAFTVEAVSFLTGDTYSSAGLPVPLLAVTAALLNTSYCDFQSSFAQYKALES